LLAGETYTAYTTPPLHDVLFVSREETQHPVVIVPLSDTSTITVQAICCRRYGHFDKIPFRSLRVHAKKKKKINRQPVVG
jgi:hypothetical protein